MQSRKRLVCHYCGKRSYNSKLEDDRFQCEKCGSINIYDENGEIVDVPPEKAGDTQRYASALAHVESNNIFCSTCVKNQHMYTSALSEFLPDPGDPRYDEIEAALPIFKEQLEQRFPQCCARCEPSVRAQLQQVTYNARSDHMRRLLARSRARRIGNRLGWRSLVVNIAGLAYSASVVVQLAWHAMGSQVKQHLAVIKWQDCLQRPIPIDCVKAPEQYLGWSLLLAFGCIWWNPKWHHKIVGNEGRLVRLEKYYRLQLTVLAIRFAAWIYLLEFPPAEMYQQMLHSLFFTFILVGTGWAVVTVKVDNTPLVNWNYQQPTLVLETQFVPPSPKVPEPAFNISNLAPAERENLQPWQPPTPPAEIESMDWTPTQQFDSPRQPRFRNTGPSPFHGTLPTLPGTMRKQKAEQVIGLPPGYFDKRDRLSGKTAVTAVMAEPKFFPRNSDTGLENIFGQVFSLHEPTSPRVPPSPIPRSQTSAPGAQVGGNQIPQEDSGRPSQVHLLFAALLMIALALWSMARVLEVAVPQLKLYVLGGVLAFCVARLAVSRVMASMQVFLLVEMLVVTALGVQLLSSDHILDDVQSKLGMGILSLLMSQELYLYLQSIQQQVTGHSFALPPPEAISVTPSVIDARPDSSNSAPSNMPINSYSTASGWKIPKPDAGLGYERRGMAGLSLDDFGSGTTRRRRRI